MTPSLRLARALRAAALLLVAVSVYAATHQPWLALPGLYTALQAARNPFVAVVACDMVFASASLVVAEALAMNESGADVVVPVNKHGFEPFHAMYRRMACLPAVRRALRPAGADGDRPGLA